MSRTDLCARLKPSARKQQSHMLDLELTMKRGKTFPTLRHLLANFYHAGVRERRESSNGMVMGDITERKIAEAALRSFRSALSLRGGCGNISIYGDAA